MRPLLPSASATHTLITESTSMQTIHRLEHTGDTVYHHTCIEYANGQRDGFTNMGYPIRPDAQGVDYVFFHEPLDCAEIASVFSLEDVAERWAMEDDDDNCIPLSALLPLRGKEIRS